MLKLEKISTFYDKIQALNEISLEVAKGGIATLIGANGAGKSTTLKTVVGWTPAASGRVLLKGEDITRVPSHKIVERGVALVPEGREVFGDMTVLENLEMGAFLRKDKKKIKTDMDWVYSLFPVLAERRKQKSKSLSGGEQQMLAISRGLMSSPDLMLLDEPSLGLAPRMVQTIFDTLVEINKQGVTLFLVEQNALMALKMSQTGYVLEKGVVTLENSSQALLEDEKVKMTYLGLD